MPRLAKAFEWNVNTKFGGKMGIFCLKGTKKEASSRRPDASVSCIFPCGFLLLFFSNSSSSFLVRSLLLDFIMKIRFRYRRIQICFCTTNAQSYAQIAILGGGEWELQRGALVWAEAGDRGFGEMRRGWLRRCGVFVLGPTLCLIISRLIFHTFAPNSTLNIW